jgi:hypothetical protein
MWPNLVVVPAPILHFYAGVVKRHEPVGVQTFGAECLIFGQACKRLQTLFRAEYRRYIWHNCSLLKEGNHNTLNASF